MPEPGDLIDRYRLVSQLGKGAMGEVWRARDEQLDRYVALKVLPPDATGDVERRARMRLEARAAAAIRHPNVVTLFDILAHQGEDILVMEIVEGRTLSEALRKDGPPPLSRALEWIEGVADALVAAHARNILHRDIKAANVMVTGDAIKVLDFGLAKLRDESNKTLPPPKRPPPSQPGELALDATMPSKSPSKTNMPLDQTALASEIDSYRTHAGQLLGTPLYMAPEQIDGAAPDERSEVFSVGVLAHEILAGKPPYSATSMDDLFRQITKEPPPALDDVPPAIEAIVARALAKDPEERYPTMQALRDAIRAERIKRFAPRARRWPLLVALAIVLVVGVGAILFVRKPSTPTDGPGDEQVRRALADYDVFVNDRALSSLRAALAHAPEHPRANAYMLLFGGASEADRAKALAVAPRARVATDDGSKDRALLDAAIALAQRGPAEARAVLTPTVIGDDRELAFWAAEFDYRAGNYKIARDEYAALLASPQLTLRGRIYDHFSSVLLYLDEPAEALRIGTLYRDAFPGEADAVGVYATTLAASGDYAKAIVAAEEALSLAEGEDTLAGLAKVLALSGDRPRAKELYRRSLDRAGPGRRPVRRAALALLHYIDGDREGARSIVAPCLPGGADAAVPERGACLFVAGILDPGSAQTIASQLDALAAERSYGAPASLATLVRARAAFFGGGCIVEPEPDTRGDRGKHDATAYDAPLDFYAAYHVPFFATWAACEKAAHLASRGDRAGANTMLRSIAARGAQRTWLLDAAKRYQ